MKAIRSIALFSMMWSFTRSFATIARATQCSMRWLRREGLVLPCWRPAVPPPPRQIGARRGISMQQCARDTKRAAERRSGGFHRYFGHDCLAQDRWAESRQPLRLYQALRRLAGARAKRSVSLRDAFVAPAQPRALNAARPHLRWPGRHRAWLRYKSSARMDNSLSSDIHDDGAKPLSGAFASHRASHLGSLPRIRYGYWCLVPIEPIQD